MSNIPLISTKPEQSPLRSDGQQFHQNQQSQQSPLNCDGQQFHQNQQNKQSPLNSDGPTIPPMSTKQTITSKQ
jgi:hypothetical protein